MDYKDTTLDSPAEFSMEVINIVNQSYETNN